MKLILLTTLLVVSCGKIESPKEVAGIPGKDGQSCHIEQVDNGRNLICEDDSTFIPDGQDGINGTDGQDGIFQGYIEYRQVCLEVPGTYIETLIYLDGEYMAYMSSNKWKEQRLVLLQENVTYKTTDGRGVLFKIVNSEIICL